MRLLWPFLLAAISVCLRAQEVLVSFSFNNQALVSAEGGQAQAASVESAISTSLVSILNERYRFWQFRQGVGSDSDYRLMIALQRGITSDWDLRLTLKYPDSTGLPEASWPSALFPYGYLPSKLASRLPRGQEWLNHVRTQFELEMLAHNADSIRAKLRVVPIGTQMALAQETDRRAPVDFNAVSAVLIPVRREAAELQDATFQLHYTSPAGSYYLDAYTISSAGRPANASIISVIVYQARLGPQKMRLQQALAARRSMRPQAFRLIRENCEVGCGEPIAP